MRRTIVVIFAGFVLTLGLLAYIACSDDSSCPIAKMTKCGGVCVDQQNDATNCGACGKKCQTDGHCIAGKCTCNQSWAPDDCNNVCTDVTMDPLNCGTCGTKCNANQVCDAKKCVAAPGDSGPTEAGPKEAGPKEAGPKETGPKEASTH
jgi:hypothetical protein